ncbi:hypothetical protein KIL84_007420 [Mauremys mutica]|uniref:Uncharacterized protein n=1 Tax=Mauremys mutica TaxID=74926 RepID=A0A9D3X1A1_9SAUR|nr:hypothetical protein KIL84_007420 [Mauremys mutica]
MPQAAPTTISLCKHCRPQEIPVQMQHPPPPYSTMAVPLPLDHCANTTAPCPIAYSASATPSCYCTMTMTPATPGASLYTQPWPAGIALWQCTLLIDHCKHYRIP